MIQTYFISIIIFSEFGIERLGCGILKRITDDSKFLFYTGGAIRRQSDGYDFGGHSSYDAFWWNLKDNTGWHGLEGTNGVNNVHFVKTNPYTGFAFNGMPYKSSNWWVWQENSFRFLVNPDDRPTRRHEFFTVAIPTTSPYMKNCFN